MRRLRIFIASPSDVAEERDIASGVVSELNRMFGVAIDTEIQAIRWETHAWPDVGEDAQGVINDQIGEFDVLVGIMWRHFGTPTRRARSGTGEEFERAYDLFRTHGRPKIMFYFRSTPFYTTHITEIAQFRKVIQFRKKLADLGVLYWTYDQPIDFERSVREHLVRQLLASNSLQPSHAGPPSEQDRVSSQERQTPITHKCQIFMAYTHEDKQGVREIYRCLRAAGHRPWFAEEEMVPGMNLDNVLSDAIAQADGCLLFFSSSSDFRHGAFQQERSVILRRVFRTTSERRPWLISVRLDDTTLPLELKGFECVDYFLPDGLETLLKAIDRASEK